MALKAGYKGVKDSLLKKILDELADLDGAKIIKSIGSGLNLSNQGALSCKSASTSQAGIVQLEDNPTSESNKVLTSGIIYDLTSIKDYASDITYEEGVTPNASSQVYYAKVGNIKLISAVLTGIVANSDTWFKILTLPVDMQPAGSSACFTAMKNNTTHSLDGDIGTNAPGDIRIRDISGAIVASDIIKFNVVYI